VKQKSIKKCGEITNIKKYLLFFLKKLKWAGPGPDQWAGPMGRAGPDPAQNQMG